MLINSGKEASARRGLSRRSVLSAAAAIAGVGVPPASASDFAGATITIIVGFPPGGGVDNGARLIARHLPRFLDGNPRVIVQNMPGAGGSISADHLYVRAPRDGLTLGVPGRDWPLAAMLTGREARFDPLGFEYIGSTGEVNTLVWVNKDLGIRTPDDFRAVKRPVIFGGYTADSLPSLVSKILAESGFPTKTVNGYRGSAAIITAIETGEVEAIATNAGNFARRPDLVAKGAWVFQLLPSAEKLPVLPDYLSDMGKKLLLLTNYAGATGMPLVAPPETPAARISALRSAFAKMARDPQFEQEADKLGESYGSPLSGEQIRAVLSATIKVATPDVLAEFRRLAEIEK